MLLFQSFFFLLFFLLLRFRHGWRLNSKMIANTHRQTYTYKHDDTCCTLLSLSHCSMIHRSRKIVFGTQQKKQTYLSIENWTKNSTSHSIFLFYPHTGYCFYCLQFCIARSFTALNLDLDIDIFKINFQHWPHF